MIPRTTVTLFPNGETQSRARQGKARHGMARMRGVTRQVKGAERVAYFARREAASVLKTVLRGDSQRRAVASIKSLVYKPSIRNKKATFALVCQTLKCLPLLQKLLAQKKILSRRWKRKAELIYVITYDILFGKGAVTAGDAEKYLLTHKDSLQSSLKHVMKENSTTPQKLLLSDSKGLTRPRYVRVNTLKLDVESAYQILKRSFEVEHDNLIPDLLVLPPGTDLHDHQLVLNGSLFLQGKASCMPAMALGVGADWQVLDACAAPGNKTVQLAALMEGRAKIIACETDSQRLRRLKEAVVLAGASNVDIVHSDFLKLDPSSSKYSKVRAILLDPSCSGSGISCQRLDHLLPSNSACNTEEIQQEDRLKKLARFQEKALLHALSFPSVEKVVYSTCSIHQCENEDVIHSVLPIATSLNFHLEAPFPEWPLRGLPVFEGAQNLLRTEAGGDMEGFFIALFVRNCGKSNNSTGKLIPITRVTENLHDELTKSSRGESRNQAINQLLNVPKTVSSKKFRNKKRIPVFGIGFRTLKMIRLLHMLSSRKLNSRTNFKKKWCFTEGNELNCGANLNM